MADRSDKTEKATPKRRKKARSEGSVAKSPDLTSWLTLLVIILAARPLLRLAAKQLAGLTMQAEDTLAHPTNGGAEVLLGHGLEIVLEMGVIVGVIAAFTGIIGTIAQIGLFASGKTLKPKFSKLNPISGVKHLISPKSAWEFAKSVTKMLIIAVVTWQSLSKMMHEAGIGTSTSLGSEISLTGDTVLNIFRTVAFLGLIFSFADFAYQKYQLTSKLKMSKQEIKDEHREAEGDPHTKGKIKSKQRQMSRMRMMAAIARADVVVMNPTHFAVAIRYQTSENPAPVVIAKGTDAMALRIRAEAHKHRIAVVEDPPLARALHAMCKLDQQIPPELFVAVARLLAFVYKLPLTGRLYSTTHSTPSSAIPLSQTGESAEENGGPVRALAAAIDTRGIA